MLKFEETKKRFIVIESRFTIDGTEKMIVKYTKDLKYKRINNDPWQVTSESDKNWFNKYYKDKFVCVSHV